MNDYDESEHVKEIFSYFGRAYYMANVFETGLALAIMQIEFLTDVKRRFVASSGVGFDRDEYEKNFDIYMNKQHALSLGNLIKSAKRFPIIDKEFQERLIDLKIKRDFAAHHFFRERSVEFCTRKGRDRMIQELEEAHSIFIDADRELEKIMDPVMCELGFTDEMIKSMQEKLMQEARDIE